MPTHFLGLEDVSSNNLWSIGALQPKKLTVVKFLTNRQFEAGDYLDGNVLCENAICQ
jgi:hypothetical protein